MRLAHPIFLLLILIVPGLVYLRYAARRRPILHFSDGQVLDQLPLTWAVAARPLLPALYALGLVLLVIALARPQKGLEESVTRTEAVDIVLLVDVSTSMREEDLSTPTQRLNRLDAAKLVIERFIKKRESDRIGMIAFAAMPYTAAPLTLDHGWLLERLEWLHTGMLEDATAIGDALASAINRLRDSKAKSKVVVLLTDGQQNAGTLLPEHAAQAAAALDIKVYTVGAASTEPRQSPFMGLFGRQAAPIDEESLRRISRITGGLYFRAGDLKGLNDTYDRIDEMETTEIEVEQYTRFEERFASFLLAGLLCLAIEKLLALTRLGVLP